MGKVLESEMMKQAIEEARKNAKNDFQDGGPFGAVIEKDGKVIAKGHNTVIASKDPTAHAEVNCIRAAAKLLETHDLAGCTLYVDAEPCPMCLSAIVWANIKTVYFANTKEQAAEIGFRDDMIYGLIKSGNQDKDVLNLVHVENQEAKELFEEFKNNEKKVMY